ncbi:MULTISPECIES: RHS repeat-associated core domain-containing protein, partial [unclassified Stenotrophomonas]|uniref:RHS repeat-associated core domain-containing protein n=1 Tax=unclassified Stenotrophomonas TaxID=196198 RepID=UPI002117FC3E
VQPDHLGTPRVVIDPVRDVAIWEWSSKSEVFGNQVPNVDADGDGVAFELALRFPGQQATDASGMFYNYQREYDPAVGRYAQSDPIGLAGGISAFAYAGGDAVSLIDPFGLHKQLGLGGSFTLAGPGLASGSGAGLGISIPEDWKKVGCYQLYGTFQLNAMLGGGLYAGGGVSATGSKSGGSLPPGLTTGVYRYAEVALGWGGSVGGSVQGSENLVEGSAGWNDWTWLRKLFSSDNAAKDQISGASLSFPPMVGVGYGAVSGSGYTVSGQVATPVSDKCGCP